MMCDLMPVLSVLASRLSTDTEVTVETSPLFTDLDSLLRLRRAGVNRMSMGVQSFNDEVLLSMRRSQTAQEAKDAFRRIVKAGFSNAGIDLIAGWPGEGVDSWRKTLEEAIALEPAHLSVYSLILESGTLLNRRVKSGESVMATDDFTMDLLALAEEILASNGYVRYEISS